MGRPTLFGHVLLLPSSSFYTLLLLTHEQRGLSRMVPTRRAEIRVVHVNAELCHVDMDKMAISYGIERLQHIQKGLYLFLKLFCLDILSRHSFSMLASSMVRSFLPNSV